MKKLFIPIFLFFIFLVFPASATSHLAGKIIALDAGHGGTDKGAVNATYGIQEKDLNLEVAYALKPRLEAAGARVVLTREGDETITSRRERVDIAKSKCAALGGECDILISIHHNGSTDSTVDYTEVFVTQKKDVALGEALYNQLLNLGLNGNGVKNDGYGMTVYGGLVSALTESYFITNDTEAELYLAGTRVPQEADLLLAGVEDYFAAQSGGDGGGKPDKCSPWPSCRN